jgi:hypothetical protein
MLAKLIIAAALFTHAGITEESAPRPLSATEKIAAMKLAIIATKKCVISEVHKDRRDLVPGSTFGDMITGALTGPCAERASQVVNMYNLYFESGGEDFFMGPFLDALPKAVQDALKKPAGPSP